jgi:hypothetical protein
LAHHHRQHHHHQPGADDFGDETAVSLKFFEINRGKSVNTP